MFFSVAIVLETGLSGVSLGHALTFQSLAKLALANSNYYTNLPHAPGIVTNHAPL